MEWCVECVCELGLYVEVFVLCDFFEEWIDEVDDD